MRNFLTWGYLVLALLGAILPWQANLEFMQASSGAGFDLSGFIRDANLTAASRSLSRDLIIGASAFTIWIATEGRRLQVKGWWVTLVLCCASPFHSPAGDRCFCIYVSVACCNSKKRTHSMISRVEQSLDAQKLQESTSSAVTSMVAELAGVDSASNPELSHWE